MFRRRAAACHTLAHANTSGTNGPNLDDAFRQDRADGFKSTAIQGLVDYWIRYPNTEGVMPAGLFKGQDAQDVAAYVAAVAAVPGQGHRRAGQRGRRQRHERRRRQAGLHRRRRLRELPHAGGRRHHRHGRSEPRHAICAPTAPPAVQGDPRRDAAEVHRDGDHQAVRLHPGGLQVGRDAAQLRTDAQAERDHGARQLPVDGGEVAAVRRGRRGSLAQPRPTAPRCARRRPPAPRAGRRARARAGRRSPAAPGAARSRGPRAGTASRTARSSASSPRPSSARRRRPGRRAG